MAFSSSQRPALFSAPNTRQLPVKRSWRTPMLGRSSGLMAHSPCAKYEVVITRMRRLRSVPAAVAAVSWRSIRFWRSRESVASL